MILPLLFLSASLALTVYWVAGRLPFPPAPAAPARPLTVLTPLERRLERDLHRAGLGRMSGHTLLTAMLLGAGLGALAALPSASANPVLIILSAVICGLLPLHLVRWQIRRRARAIRAAAASALALIARLQADRRHPALAISDALPGLAQPLKAEFALALRQSQAGLPLPEALRALAARCEGDFCLYQFAELVAISLRSERAMDCALEHLVERMRTGPALPSGGPAWLLTARWLGEVAVGSAMGALLCTAVTQPLGAVICLAAALGALTYGLLLRQPRFSPRQAMIRRLPPAATATGPAPPRGRGMVLWQFIQARHRRALLARAWPDLAAHLEIQSQTGAGLQTTLASSLPILREPLRTEVEDLVADLRISPLPTALERFVRRCDLPEIRAFVQSRRAREETAPGASNPSAI